MAVISLDNQAIGLVVVDPQEKLLGVMRRGQTIVDNIVRLLQLAGHYELPVITTQQYRKMMGPIAPDIAPFILGQETIDKMAFGCCAVSEFNDRLRATGKKIFILVGLEAHICILQTCVGLLASGFEVHVPQDAVDSRTKENWQVGIALMKEAGAVISSTETLIFQVLRKAGTPQFKDMLRIVK